MRRILLLALLVTACGKPDDADRKKYSVTVAIPPATPYRDTVTRSDGTVRPRLDDVTGVCMGRWQSHFPTHGPAFVLSLDHDGTFRLSGDKAGSGRWKVAGRSIGLGAGAISDCGRDIAHLVFDGGSYSLRRLR